MGNNKTSIDLLSFFEKNALSKNPDEFIHTIYNFFIRKFPEINFTVLGFNYLPDAYKILINSDFSKKIIDELLISDKSKKSKENNFIKFDNLYIFLLCDELDKICYLLIFENIVKSNSSEVGQLCIHAQMLFRILSINLKTNEESLKDSCANLISQISHDFNSMISLIGKENINNENLQHKIEYSEQMTREILFYIRDIDIIPSRVSIKKLIESIVKNITAPENINFEYSIDDNLDQISVDVELINKALESILKNAFSAVSSNNGNVVLTVACKKNNSLFISHDWLELDITDNGTGIPPDFLPLVKNPFFTTFKPEGHCGFGLTNAEKIIKGHDGCVLIESIENKETNVKIFIPLKSEL